jgi:hypothetical protein
MDEEKLMQTNKIVAIVIVLVGALMLPTESGA